jgi:hypothetical protein
MQHSPRPIAFLASRVRIIEPWISRRPTGQIQRFTMPLGGDRFIFTAGCTAGGAAMSSADYIGRGWLPEAGSFRQAGPVRLQYGLTCTVTAKRK